MKTKFGRSSIVGEQWFNSIQRLKFVANPVDDGEYPRLCEKSLNLDSIDSNLITIGTEQVLGSIGQLLDCQVVDTPNAEGAISKQKVAELVADSGKTTLRGGVGVSVVNGVVGLTPAAVTANQVLLGDGVTISYGEILSNRRGGGNVTYRINFPIPYKSYPNLLGLHVKYVNDANNRYAVINAGILNRLELVTLTGASISAYWDQGGGGVPAEYSLYYSFIGQT